MAEYRIVPATPELVRLVVRDMRRADKDEVWASSHRQPLDACVQSCLGSRDPKVALADDNPLCIFGIAPATALGYSASPWMLSTVHLPAHTRIFLEASRVFIRRAMMEFSYLHNYADARNTVALRWLRWLGFRVYPAEPFGPDNLPFHFFDMGERHV